MPNAKVIFITGNSRSGTTMMSRILGNHDEVYAFQELHFFDEVLASNNAESKIEKKEAVKLFAFLCAIQRNGYFGSRNFKPFIAEAEKVINDNSEYSYIGVYARFLKYETERNSKSIPCEQTPQNIFSIDEILSHIKGSKVLIMVRDPREVLLSQKNKWKRRQLSGGEIPFWESVRSKINYHPITISKIWKAAMSQAMKLENRTGVLIIKYEDLVANAESTMQKVCTHVGINYSSGLTDIPIVGSSNFSDNKNLKGIDSSKKGAWKNGGLSSAEIFICQRITDKQMKHFGYEQTVVHPNAFNLLWYKISLPFRLTISVLFNLKRFKNPRKLLKRFSN